MNPASVPYSTPSPYVPALDDQQGITHQFDQVIVGFVDNLIIAQQAVTDHTAWINYQAFVSSYKQRVSQGDSSNRPEPPSARIYDRNKVLDRVHKFVTGQTSMLDLTGTYTENKAHDLLAGWSLTGPVKAQPNNPLGVEIEDNNGGTGMFNPAPGDILPVGSIYTLDGMTFTKIVYRRIGPFGVNYAWVRTH